MLPMILTFIMLGATLGFLLHNFYPAKIFCGDCAMFLGFIIAVITLLEFKGPALTSLFVPIMILGIPILDTLFAIIRRLAKGKSIKAVFQPDKGHLHHRLVEKGFTQKQAVLILYGLSASLGMFAIILFDSGIWKALSFLLMIIAAVAIGYKNFMKEKEENKRLIEEENK